MSGANPQTPALLVEKQTGPSESVFQACRTAQARRRTPGGRQPPGTSARAHATPVAARRWTGAWPAARWACTPSSRPRLWAPALCCPGAPPARLLPPVLSASPCAQPRVFQTALTLPEPLAAQMIINRSSRQYPGNGTKPVHNQERCIRYQSQTGICACVNVSRLADALVCRRRHALNELCCGALVLRARRLACRRCIAICQAPRLGCCLGGFKVFDCYILIPDLAGYLCFLTAEPQSSH